MGTTAWAVAGTAAGPVTSVTAAAAPVWGDGAPDLFAATGHDVLGSDDALTFASLPGLPDLSAEAWPAIAWAGQPERALLIAGAQQAGFFGRRPDLGLRPRPASTASSRAVAPGGQSVAYLLDADGRLMPHAQRRPGPRRGHAHAGPRRRPAPSTRLTATVRVAAPGAVVLRTRVPGRCLDDAAQRRLDGRRTGAGACTFDLSPSLTHDYRLEFKYGGTTTQLAPVTQVTVVPRITTARSRYDLRAGDRLPLLRLRRAPARAASAWSCSPTAAAAGDRSACSAPSRCATAAPGRAARSARPKAETYHLRAHLARTRTHAEAWSRIVTVTIR